MADFTPEELELLARPPTVADLRLYQWFSDGYNGDPADLAIGFMIGMRVTLRHPEWAQAFDAQSHIPREDDDDDLLVEANPVSGNG